MNRLSIKIKVTLWYVAFMLIIVLLVLTFILSISDNLLRSSSQSQLKSIVEKSLEEIEFDDGALEIDDDLDFFQNGAYLSVYDKNGSLVYGRTPSDFTGNIAFSSGEMQTVGDGDQQWYVYDLLMPIEGYGDIWVRGVTSPTDSEGSIQTMKGLAIIALPFIVILGAVGGYYITKRAFRPISKIIESAETISGGNDLSKRINLGSGKDEIYTLARTFDSMFMRLQQSFESEKQFTADASHELRTPTSVIISQCEYALENAKDLDETKEALSVVLAQSKKMSGLIAQLLTLARTDKGSQILNLELVNFSEIAEMVIEEQRFLTEDKHIEIQSQIEPNIILRADQTMLMRLLINLISNAIAYGKNGGHIWVELIREEILIRGIVKDDGIGIAEEKLGKIWDRFFQVDPSRTAGKSEGMGLGLSMCQWICEAHGGEIYVESVFGEGSTFYFKIPFTS